MCPFYSECVEEEIKKEEKYCKPSEKGAAKRIHLLSLRVPLTIQLET